MEVRTALLATAEAQLARGDLIAAIETFERAAAMLHAPDTEMGLVRAYMQAGQYRRALAFCAHAAGAHLEAPSASALYAWLLKVGGQSEVGERVLRDTLARAPQDAVALQARKAFDAPRPLASGVLLQPPHRMAPYEVMEPGQADPPSGARIVTSGVLINSATMALAPTAAAFTDQALWVRNGLGRTTQARVEREQPLSAMGVTVLRLDTALERGRPVQVVLRDPFAGSASFAIEYAGSSASQPAWPWLTEGFFGTLGNDPGHRRLNIDVSDGLGGGPILDASGRLAGMLVNGGDAQAMMVPESQWRMLQGGVVAAPESDRMAAEKIAARLMPADEAYEIGLRLAVQIIAAR